MAEKTKKTADPCDVVRRLSYLTDSCVVFFSCGKDAAATLELCREWFKRVAAVYMYYTPGLSFHERYLDYWERRCGERLVGGKIHRLPHWQLSRFLAAGYYREESDELRRVPILSVKDVEVRMAKETGIDWFCHGMKKNDSLERRAMLSQCNGIMLEAHRAYPLAEWTHRSVVQFLRSREIPLSPEYDVLGWSYNGGLEPKSLAAIRDRFPEDYAKVIARFPYAEAGIARHELGILESKLKDQA